MLPHRDQQHEMQGAGWDRTALRSGLEQADRKPWRRRRVWRSTEEGREMLDVPDMRLLGLLTQTPNVHIFDHPLAQRACSLSSVMGASCLMIEKAPIVSQNAEIIKCASDWSGQHTRQMRHCRGDAVTGRAPTGIVVH